MEKVMTELWIWGRKVGIGDMLTVFAGTCAVVVEYKWEANLALLTISESKPLVVRFLRAQSGAKGSSGSGDGYLADTSRGGGGFRLIWWWMLGGDVDIMVQLEEKNKIHEESDNSTSEEKKGVVKTVLEGLNSSYLLISETSFTLRH